MVDHFRAFFCVFLQKYNEAYLRPDAGDGTGSPPA